MVFVSPHCPHCPKAAAMVARVAPQYEGVRHEKIRVKTDKGKRLSVLYGINVYPTTLIFNDAGKLKHKISGVPDEGAFKDKIERLLGSKKSFFGRFFK